MFKYLMILSILGYINSNPVPAEFDWRTKGVILPVINQGTCGYSTVINALDAISSYSKLQGKELIRLSQQQVYDCSGDWCPCGKVGNSTQAYDLIIAENFDNQIDSDESYPYTGKCTHECKFTKSGVALSFSGYMFSTNYNNEPNLKQMLMDGPLIVYVRPDTPVFMNYTGGIMDDHSCDGTFEQYVHTLLLVGYGSENGKDFWIARNTWGTTWGESGYIRIVRDKNMCGVGLSIAKPFV